MPGGRNSDVRSTEEDTPFDDTEIVTFAWHGGFTGIGMNFDDVGFGIGIILRLLRCGCQRVSDGARILNGIFVFDYNAVVVRL